MNLQCNTPYIEQVLNLDKYFVSNKLVYAYLTICVQNVIIHDYVLESCSQSSKMVKRFHCENSNFIFLSGYFIFGIV